MARVLIKIDRNGTKYYSDDTCRRCGGLGERSEWYNTGFYCFECGGTGHSAPRIEKVYTPEYEAKLEVRRLERMAKKEGFASVEEMQAARAAEWARAEAEREAAEARAKAEAEAARKAEEERKAVSKWVGRECEKLEMTVTYIGSPHFTRRKFAGYGTETCFIHTFVDENGNKLVWMTGKGIEFDEGQQVRITGTVKEHSEYKGEKQTSLSRCKIQAA